MVVWPVAFGHNGGAMAERSTTTPEPVAEAAPASEALTIESPLPAIIEDGEDAADAEEAQEVAVEVEGSGEYSTLVLATAGVAVFDTAIFIGFLLTLAIQPDQMLELFQAVAGVALAAAIAPIILGAVVLQRNRESGVPMPGTPWATYAVMIGVLLALLVLAVPLVTALMAILN